MSKDKVCKCGNENDKIFYICMVENCENHNNEFSLYCKKCMELGKLHPHFPLIKIYIVIEVVQREVLNILEAIKKFCAGAKKSYQQYEALIKYLESEAQRIKAQNMHSIEADYKTMLKLEKEEKVCAELLDKSVNNGEIYDVFKSAD